MQRLNAASCLLIALLSGAAVRLAAERVKVEVVQTHTGIRLGSCGLELETGTEPARSRCNRSSGTYSRELGFHCAGSRSSTNLPAESRGDSALFYDLRVIMPNARRLVFHCSTILDQNCAGFPDYPEETAVECSDFVSGGQAYKDCTATGPVDGRIGIYEAALHGDRMTIFGPKWRRSYMEYGTWQLAAVVAQDPKPMPQEPQPAAPQESKPAAPESSPAEPESTPGPVPETKPSAPQEAKPDASETQGADMPDPAPAADTTADSKRGNPPGSGVLSSNGADQLIDPRVIEQAKAGDMIAQYKLGYHYFLGRGVPVDYVQAAIWWRKAADQGYPEAQNNLGVLYNSGKGVPQSFAEAYFWQNLAAARATGERQVQFAKNRDESASKLWLLSRLKVQQRAAKWAAEHPVQPRSHEPREEEKRGQYP